MNKQTKIILVTGATGKQGGAVASALIADGWRVRALVRDPEKPSAKLLAEMDASIAQGDLRDRPSLDAALQNVYGVFSVQAWHERGVEDEIQQACNLADAAKAADVQHFVYTSVAAAERPTAIPFFESKGRIEEHIVSLGLPCTIFRPVFFMENFSEPSLRSSILNGCFSMPLDPDKPLQMISVEDIAACVVAAFNRPEQFMDHAFDIAADEVSPREAAELFSRELGYHVQYGQTPIEEIRARNPGYARMYEWMNQNQLTHSLGLTRQMFPQVMTLEQWIRKTDWVQQAREQTHLAGLSR